ncbi:MAG TPA: YqiA/YcfP family alpha/beta fold hydrolase [Bryobacteraceae bacterium]
MSNSLSILYLHGFASSPQSRKARFFAGKLAALGVPVEIPDLAEGNFERLTVSRQLELVNERVAKQKRILIGSSLGGYLAALFAARHPELVERMVLLAPAFGFHELWAAECGPERLEQWRRNGTVPIFHYGEGREMPLSYEFFEDSARYEPFPDARQPALIFHGNLDQVVPIEQSLAFVRLHPQAHLVRCASGHELTDVLESIWYQTEPFLLGDFSEDASS